MNGVCAACQSRAHTPLDRVGLCSSCGDALVLALAELCDRERWSDEAKAALLRLVAVARGRSS